jgi:dTDP-D-glucose 4,6-dehydratase
MAKILQEHQPRAIVNFAAESHVDRSIHGPDDFMQTNIWAPIVCWKKPDHFLIP